MIGNVITAVRQGSILVNATTWKNRQLAVNALVAFVGAALAIAKSYGYSLPIDEESLVALSGGVVAIVLLFNGWATAATSTKVGLPVRNDPDTEQGTDGSSDQTGLVDNTKTASI